MKNDPEKDYYGTLGVTSIAELAVIKAAYKVLASIYHPDKNSSDDATQKMIAINEAWEILSDPVRRKKYDGARGATEKEDHIFGDSEGKTAGADFLEKDWKVAISYYPDLKPLGERLTKISWRLSVAFKAHLLEGKDFRNRSEIAKEMEDNFLKTYFGSDKQILNLAKGLMFPILNKKLLRELNIAVNTLGTSDPDVIASRFRSSLGKEPDNIAFFDRDILMEHFSRKGYKLTDPFFLAGYIAYTPAGEKIRFKNWREVILFYKEHIYDY
jgi:curved DNA-binding protein CbpA